MRFSSIFYTITLIFTLGIGAIGIAFLWLIEYDKANYARELNTKYSIVARATLLYLNEIITQDEYKEQLSNLYMPPVINEDKKEKIIKEAATLEEISTELGVSAILFHQKKNYLKITKDDETLLLIDTAYQSYRYIIIQIIFAFVAGIILLTYIFIIRKIMPLGKLKREIDKFAQGDLEIKNVATGNDEISQVASAFYEAVSQIKNLNKSRQLFLRNIMHELKTPITKGRITAEMIEKNKNQERLIDVFERLESLINEFAAVERATSRLVGELKPCKVRDVIDEAIDIAMADSSNVKVEAIDDTTIKADFKLLAIACKNMIDNALKYSDDKSLKIIISNNEIIFSSKGAALENDLKYYIEPFTQGSNAKKSFGLGLYIVYNILEAHKLKLLYNHQNGVNNFIFSLNKSNQGKNIDK
ncbi:MULTISPECIES: ArsS family sensor histidine kinase [Campylobacter]|uniref:histidine kinase n=1 Tax=Campylobacter porcelli TaxID=1660073 RepID=A0ABU7M2M4_9BACT|nr:MULTISPECIES: ArsS family sensor histidine kinase [unclassified Campylobacter]MCR8678330.1 ArsS family sensor histidine kinase [Campylobacter sp. RM19072]MCR8695681.1 ArsS family sensor histidine kinase [Campylobacter sp. RM19073]MEE3704317.1 ArsS family sensor histidine kinase [Campylobacter sp. CX2-8023-23]MEE3743964.1 ArsS family sensor histidine kinase [Campylobacter sp. CX2-4855-23]MEE3776222.1 ArsS family sensor histidine kinase [Campylobacter sp. CX2-4080-23]